MNPIENVWNIIKKYISNQIPCIKEELSMRVCEAWYGVALNVLEELHHSLPRSIADLIKAKGCNEILTLWCRRTMLLYFHLNVFKICCCVK